MFDKFNSVLSAILRQTGVGSGFSTSADFILDTRVPNHALQEPRPRHQDIVFLLLAERECQACFLLCALEVTIVQMQVSAIQVNTTDAMVVRILLVDGTRFRQGSKRLLP